MFRSHLSSLSVSHVGASSTMDEAQARHNLKANGKRAIAALYCLYYKYRRDYVHVYGLGYAENTRRSFQTQSAGFNPSCLKVFGVLA